MVAFLRPFWPWPMQFQVPDEENSLLMREFQDFPTTLFQAMSCEAEIQEDGYQNQSRTWYLRLLRNRLRVLPHSISSNITTEGRQDIMLDSFLHLLERIVILFSSRADLALEEILADATAISGLVKDDESTTACQLLFICIGMVTMLYTPLLSPDDGVFQIKAQSRRTRTQTWAKSSKPIEDTDQPFSTLLRYFGGAQSPLPVPMAMSDVPAGGVGTASLASTNLNYYTMSRLCGLRIVWVESVCEHLEFDMQQRTLKLFCFPSFCAIMCSGASESNFLERFFDEYMADVRLDPGQNLGSKGFYEEILYTYRLLFGQDQNSWKAFKSDYKQTPHFSLQNSSLDPVLWPLCTSDWSKLSLIDVMRVLPPKVVYSAHIDFPFFSRRLVNLQDFVLTQCPDGWKSLWLDRRDVGRFWTLWAVMIFGSISIVLSLVQIALGIAQVVPAYQESS